MTTHPHHRQVAILIGLISMATLTGCAGEGADPNPETSSQPPPVPVEPVVEIDRPTPTLDIACDGLANVDTLSEFLVSPVALQPKLTSIDLDADTGPSRYALATVGGIECEWSNGAPGRTGYVANPDFVGATIRVLPDAGAAWAHFTVNRSDASAAACFPGAAGTSCRADRLVGDNWVEVQLHQVRPDGAEAAAESIVSAAVDAVGSAGAVASDWAHPSGTLPVADGCDSLFSLEQAQAALGTTEPIFFDGVDGGFSLTAGAWLASKASPCPWVSTDGHGIGVLHQVLRGGGWAFEDAEVTGSPMSIPGLSGDDQAVLSCQEPSGACTADLLVGRNWIRIYIFEDAVIDAPISDKAGALEALSTAAVAAIDPATTG